MALMAFIWLIVCYIFQNQGTAASPFTDSKKRVYFAIFRFGCGLKAKKITRIAKLQSKASGLGIIIMA
jgi:hypothetical protein